MKKLILPVLVCLFAFGSINAETLKFENNIEITESVAYEVSNFCKLIQKGHYDAVKALIESGENVNRKSTGLTPLMFAARHNKHEIVKLLIKHGAKLHTKCDKRGMTALEIAKQSKAIHAIKAIEDAM